MSCCVALSPVGAPTFLISHAQAATDAERAGARALAAEAFDAYEAGEYDKTIDLLRRAESLVHSPAHLLYIARAQAKLGRLVLAQEAYLKAAREPLTEDSAQGFRDSVGAANTELEALQPRIARVTVQVSGVENSQASVTVDGTPVPSALVGVPMPVDPGTRVFAAAAPGMLPANQRVDVAEGGSATVQLNLSPDPNAPAPNAATPPPTDTPTPAQPLSAQAPTDSTFLYLGIGSAVVGGVALGFGFSQLSKEDAPRSQANTLFSECNPSPAGCSDDERNRVTSLDDEADGYYHRGVALAAIGAVGLAAGATLIVLHFTQSDEADPTHATLTPWVGPTGLGLSGTF